MDDLDHSMCIADHDWKSFYEETEECWLLQPLLACPDNWSLSDSEDSGNLGRLELCWNPAAASEDGESNAVRRCAGDGEISQSRSGGAQGELTAEAEGERGRQAEPATCRDITAPSTEAVLTGAEAHARRVTSVPGTLQTERQKAPSPAGEATGLQRGDEDSQKESDALSPEEPDPLSPELRELSAGRDVSGSAEKQRWFITMSDGPARPRARAKSAKSKTRQKKSCRKEKEPGSGPKEKASGRGGEMHRAEVPAEHPSSGEGAVARLALPSARALRTDVDRQNPGGWSSSTSASGMGSEAGDSMELVPAHGWDSDSYLSVEEHSEEVQPLPGSPPLRKSPTCESIVCPGPETVSHECCSTDAALALPPADRTPDECRADEGCVPAEMPGPRACGPAHPLASVPNLPGGLPGMPDSTATPRMVAHNPETYAAAAGHRRPVYAISAFWDEMEKLTINDILQLRTERAFPPAATARGDALAAGHGLAVDPAEQSSLLDGSDAADSDYFTQPDDSKHDRSSCEFSASDLEEEHWHSLGTSRNPSPEPKPCVEPRRGREEDEESTGSEGRDTPVPLDGSADGSIEDQQAFIPGDPPDLRPILRSKSLRNIQALSTSDLGLVSEDGSRSFLCSSPSLEGEKLVVAGNGLESQTSVPFSLDAVAGNGWTRLSFLAAPECYCTEENRRSIIVHDPEDISLVSALDHSFLHTFCCSHVGEGKPIPIFSCSHSAIRELAFASYTFLSTDPLGNTIFPLQDMGDTRGTVCGLSSEAPEWFHAWSGLLPMRKIHFHGKGSMWWRGSGTRWLPFEDHRFCPEQADLATPQMDLESVSTTGAETRRDLAMQQGKSDAIKMNHFFFKLRQSDMCLVCIAFASWVLRSSDPDADDTWKAALLANVSALSAIQYLRQYVLRKPSKDNP